MKRNTRDYGRIESTFGKRLGAEVHRPRPSGPRRRAGDEVFKTLAGCRSLIETLCRDINHLRVKLDLTRSDAVRLDRAARYAKLIVDYFQLRKPAVQICQEWNSTLEPALWDDEFNCFTAPPGEPIEPPRGGQWTPRKIEHLIQALRCAAKGFRMDGKPRSHGQRGRPQKYLLIAA